MSTTEATQPKWMDLEDAAPDLLDGEDAQAWVSQSRRESDEERDDVAGIAR